MEIFEGTLLGEVPRPGIVRASEHLLKSEHFFVMYFLYLYIDVYICTGFLSWISVAGHWTKYCESIETKRRTVRGFLVRA